MKTRAQVEAAQAGSRIDLFVGEVCQLSRAKVKALFEDGQVRLNGKRAKKGVSVAAGDVIEVELPEPTAAGEGATADASLALTVLHEDEHLVFVAKPAGMPTQPLKAGELGTVANALIARFPQMANVGDDPREAGLCHRLDVETSGVLLAAKTREAWQAMRAAFSEEKSDIEKRYLALVSGPLADSGEIAVPLKHAGDHVVPSEAEGRPALTLFTVQRRKGSYSLVDVTLVTGVLHQVRAHLAAIGAPIVGDALYGGRAVPGLSRFFLHAASLAITHPVTGRRLTVECPLPTELTSVLGQVMP